MPTVHLIVKGKVQGVFYRATAKKIADENNIVGWVQNMEDGNVEILATAPDEALQTFIEWCYQGPRMAKVTEIKKENKEEQPFNEFMVKR